jgi:hypothetical protein
MIFVHESLAKKKREEELKKKNHNAKLRIQEIASGSQTQWSGNLIYDLKGVNETVKMILDPKYSEEEYEELLGHHDIQNTQVLKDSHFRLTKEIDPLYRRLFNKYVELLLVKKEEGMLRNKVKQNKNVVTFHEEIIQIENELRKLINN